MTICWPAILGKSKTETRVRVTRDGGAQAISPVGIPRFSGFCHLPEVLVICRICDGSGRIILTAEMKKRHTFSDSFSRFAKTFTNVNISQSEMPGYVADCAEGRVKPCCAEHRPQRQSHCEVPCARPESHHFGSRVDFTDPGHFGRASFSSLIR